MTLPANDRFRRQCAEDAGPIGGPLTRFRAVTKSDEDDLEFPCRAVYVGTAGNLAVIGAEDAESVVLPSMAAGVWHWMRLTKILSTGTTAQGIVIGD